MQGGPPSLVIFNIILEILQRAIVQKETSRLNEQVKLFFYAQEIIMYIESPKIHKNY
jgi:hypothetical protein